MRRCAILLLMRYCRCLIIHNLVIHSHWLIDGESRGPYDGSQGKVSSSAKLAASKWMGLQQKILNGAVKARQPLSKNRPTGCAWPERKLHPGPESQQPYWVGSSRATSMWHRETEACF